MKLNEAPGGTMPAGSASTESHGAHSRDGSAVPDAVTKERAFGCGEDERLRIIASFGTEALVDDDELTAIAKFAAELCDAPLAMVSIIEAAEQRFLAREGLEERGTPRDIAFCSHAIEQPGLMEVRDTSADPRFAAFPHVAGEPGVRFYAGQTLVSSEGAPLGTLCVLDMKARHDGLTKLQRGGLEVLATAALRRLQTRRSELAARDELAGNREHTFEMLNEISQIAFSINPEGKFDFYNRQFFEFTDAEPPEDPEGWRVLVHPEDVERVFSGWYKAVKRAEPFTDEFRIRYRDTSWRWVHTRTNPVGPEKGGERYWFGTMTDIHDSYTESENRDLLARELSHRIKNIFAVVSSLVSIRSRGKPEVQEFADDLTQTIGALGRAHDYVRPLEGRKGVSLHGLLRDLLAPYHDASDSRITISGDDKPIGARAATPLALVVHELATNSAKYGALSDGDGTVSVTIEPVGDGDRLSIVWQEDSGVEMPDAGPEGFGSRLVKLAVEGQLDGRIERTFAARGLRAELVVSIEALAS